MVERASQLASEAKADNIKFETGDIFKLPYPDASFDAAYEESVLQHVNDPLAAMKEMRRLIRPGGFIVLQDSDSGLEVNLPETPLSAEREQVRIRSYQLYGGSPFYARHQRRLLLEAGCSRAEQIAIPHCWGSPADFERDNTGMERRFRRHLGVNVEEGLIDQKHAEELLEDFRVWFKRPDAFNLTMVFAAIGFVD
jgi:SAM-dependent methyltransferase